MAQKRARLTDDNNPLRSKTDDFLDGLGQVNHPSTQEADKLTIQEADKLKAQEDSKPTIQPANTLRKATFKLSEEVLRRLDNFHLQLQLDLGKADAPYKEVIVEEAICRLLDQAELTPGEVLSALRTRQGSRGISKD